MARILHTITNEYLPLFDRLVFLQSRCTNSEAATLLSALFFVISTAAAFALLLYWGYCASRILACGGAELTDAEFDSLQWPRHGREQFLQAFLFGRLTLP